MILICETGFYSQETTSMGSSASRSEATHLMSSSVCRAAFSPKRPQHHLPHVQCKEESTFMCARDRSASTYKSARTHTTYHTTPATCTHTHTHHTTNRQKNQNQQQNFKGVQTPPVAIVAHQFRQIGRWQQIMEKGEARNTRMPLRMPYLP